MTKPFVRVVWRDAEDGPTWASEKEVHAFAEQECLAESFGYLIRRSKQFVTLAADRSLSGNNPGELGRICKIPRKMIQSIEEVALVATPSPVDTP